MVKIKKIYVQFRKMQRFNEDAFKVWRQIYKNLAIDAYDMIAEFQEKHRQITNASVLENSNTSQTT